MALIYQLSSESNPLPQLTALVWDKLIHTCEYALLAGLLARALLGEGIGWLVAITLAIVATSAYGATDEWHQFFVPGRQSDVFDWVSDTIGAGIGAAAYMAAATLYRRIRANRA